MKNSYKAAVLGVGMLFASTAFAEQGKRDFGQIYTQCGLGGLIAQGIDDKGTADVIAAVTNVTWDLGTTAISSNISSPETCARSDAKTAALIIKSYPMLERDLAAGNGKYLDALKQSAALSDEQVNKVRNKFGQLVSSSQYERMSRTEKARALYKIVMDS